MFNLKKKLQATVIDAAAFKKKIELDRLNKLIDEAGTLILELDTLRLPSSTPEEDKPGIQTMLAELNAKWDEYRARRTVLEYSLQVLTTKYEDWVKNDQKFEL